MALFTTFLTTPTVMAIYQPLRAFSAADHSLKSVSTASSGEFRILACIHGPSNIPSLLNLIESTRSSNKSSRLKLYVMHLVELTDRSSSIIMVQRLRKNGFPLINRLRAGTQLADRVAAALQANSQLGRVNVRPATAISALATMHEDIRHVAEEKAVAMIVLPFHKKVRKIDGEDVVETVCSGWRGVNERVLKEAPCTVAVLVDRGCGGGGANLILVPTATAVQNVCVLFSGGPDDKQALELGRRMAEHPAVKVAVIRFIEKDGIISGNPPVEKVNDEGDLAEFMTRLEGRVELIEKLATNIADEVIAIGRSGDYNLIIVGKGWPSAIPVAPVMEHPELGPIGDVLASSGHGISASVLVVQQCTMKEPPDSKRALAEGGGGKRGNGLKSLV